MNGPEHYKEAERLITHASSVGDNADCAVLLACAQVHATLAQTAAVLATSNTRLDPQWDTVGAIRDFDR